MRSNGSRFLAVLPVALSLATAGAHAADGTTSITDDRGVKVEVPLEPKRVAGVSYFAADVALALGIKPVATTYMTAGREPDFLMGLTKDLVQVGQRARPELETLSRAKPDIIVAMKRYTVGNAEQFRKIAPYVAYNMELLTESYDEVAQFTRVLGKAERGEALNAEFRRHLAEYAARAPKDVHPRFQIMFAGDAPFSFHTENTAAAIVAALGGDNVAGPMPAGGRFGLAMSLETMLERDPEVIFVHDWGPDRPHEGNPIWKQLSAVKNGRVHTVGDHWSETNGPIAREIVLREAAHFLHPSAFPKIDVRSEAAKLIPAGVR